MKLDTYFNITVVNHCLVFDLTAENGKVNTCNTFIKIKKYVSSYLKGLLFEVHVEKDICQF
jgi:hypothetical protein